MKPLFVCGFILILLFAIVMVNLTFFPDSSSTVEQQHNALYAGLASAVVGVICMLLGKAKTKVR